MEETTLVNVQRSRTGREPTRLTVQRIQRSPSLAANPSSRNRAIFYSARTRARGIQIQDEPR